MKLLKFSAVWCGPCIAIAHSIDRAKIDIEIENIDVDQNPEKQQEYGVRGIPTLILVEDDGTEIRRISGAAISTQDIQNLVSGG